MALLSVTFLLAHSLIDYPLRTMALALSFAFLNAIIFHTGSFARGGEPEPAIEMERDEDGILVTMATTARE